MSENHEPAGAGHNKMPEEALFLSHFSKLRSQESKVEAKKAELDAERAIMTDLFRTAKADGFSRKELQHLLDDSKSSRRDLEAEEERRVQLRTWLGMPAGTQADLFASLPEEVKDEQYYEGQGYAAGLRGDDREAPEGTPPRFIQAHLRGWHEGQEKLCWALAESGRRTEKKDTGVAAQPLAPNSDEDSDFDPAAEAAKLKNAGFLDASSTEREEVPAELSDIFPGETSEIAEKKAAGRARRRAASAVH